jgi:hypothetical protein
MMIQEVHGPVGSVADCHNDITRALPGAAVLLVCQNGKSSGARIRTPKLGGHFPGPVARHDGQEPAENGLSGFWQSLLVRNGVLCGSRVLFSARAAPERCMHGWRFRSARGPGYARTAPRATGTVPGRAMPVRQSALREVRANDHGGSFSVREQETRIAMWKSCRSAHRRCLAILSANGPSAVRVWRQLPATPAAATAAEYGRITLLRNRRTSHGR